MPGEYLSGAMLEKFGGGPVGADKLAAAIGGVRDAIKDGPEPCLIQESFLQRSPRERAATASICQHFQLMLPKSTKDLWKT